MLDLTKDATPEEVKKAYRKVSSNNNKAQQAKNSFHKATTDNDRSKGPKSVAYERIIATNSVAYQGRRHARNGRDFSKLSGNDVSMPY